MKVESSSPDSYIGSVAGGPHKVADQQSNAGAQAAAAGAAATPSAPQQAAGVTVTLSSSASQALSSSGDGAFNAEKVEAMKQAISDGSFKINPEAIADKMLSNAAEMLSATAGGAPA